MIGLLASRRRGKIGAVVALISLLVSLAGIGLANASSLRLTSAARDSTDTIARCAPSTTTISLTAIGSAGSYTGVTAAGIPPGCTSADIIISDVNGSSVSTPVNGAALSPTATPGTYSANGSFTVAAGHAVYPLVRLNGWAVASSWANTPASVPAVTGPITPGGGSAYTPTITDWQSLTSSNGKQFCVNIVVTGNSVTPVAWSIDLHVNLRPFNGDADASHYQIQMNNNIPYGFTTTTAQNGILSITGAAIMYNNHDYSKISSADRYTFQVCNYNVPAPVYDPSLTYHISNIADPSNNACVKSVVSVDGVYPFYAGWRDDVDMSAQFAAHPRATRVTVVSQTGTLNYQSLGNGVYRITPATWDWNVVGVRNAGGSDPAVSQSFSVCVS